MFDSQIRFLKGVGPVRSELLGRLGIDTAGDLLLHLPRTYLDRRTTESIASLTPGMKATVSGEIVHTGTRTIRGGRKLFNAVLSDGTGRLTLTFFQPRYIQSRLKTGTKLSASGKVDFFGGMTMTHPALCFPEEGDRSILQSGGVVPVYPLTTGITQATMRKLMKSVLDLVKGSVPEVLPVNVLAEHGWSGRYQLFCSVHRPSAPDEGERARKMLALEELYLYQMVLRRVRMNARSVSSVKLEFSSEDILKVFGRSLPFEMTLAQRRVIRELLDDLSEYVPMRRLIQGDVGSGKTVVAAATCFACCRSGSQAVVLAPTEVLAAQHMKTFSRFLNPLGVKCGLLTGGTPAGSRKKLLELVSGMEIQVLIGTHAVLEPDVGLSRLGLLIVDEQHKFGVSQREVLLSDRRPRPHMLVMSATPIPRTLAMTFYGDLDLSVIDEIPPGRGKTATAVITGNGRRRVFRLLAERVGMNERAYIVYPLREISKKQDLHDAASAWKTLSSGTLAKYGVGLLYGTMTASEKLKVTEEFASGKIGILVSTTVVEVGLDVPEATVMVVANAERFGLSQLHQLRGRIGRGGKDSWCFLVAGDNADDRAMTRLNTLASTTSGFVVAEKDLALRGPGQVIGTKQHGLPEFRIADLLEDSDLVAKALELAGNSSASDFPASEALRRFGDASVPGI